MILYSKEIEFVFITIVLYVDSAIIQTALKKADTTFSPAL